MMTIVSKSTCVITCVMVMLRGDAYILSRRGAPCNVHHETHHHTVCRRDARCNIEKRVKGLSKRLTVIIVVEGDEPG